MKNGFFSIVILFNSFLYCQTDSFKINYNLIDSYPQNAEVFINGVYVGSTPLYFVWGDSVFPKTISVRMKGFLDVSETFSTGEIIKRDYILQSLRSGFKLNPVKENELNYFSSPREVFPIVGSSVAVLSSGFLAFYFKQLSIQNKEAYEQSGDPEILKRKNRYDIISGISIGVFQVSFSVLLYFLFKE